jgi:hypothetical protein
MSAVLAILLFLLGGLGGFFFGSEETTGSASSSGQSGVHAQLRNAAVAEETYFTDHETYTRSLKDLGSAGYQPVERVTLAIVSMDVDSYCMSATAVDGSARAYYNSAGNGLTDEPCGPAVTPDAPAAG